MVVLPQPPAWHLLFYVKPAAFNLRKYVNLLLKQYTINMGTGVATKVNDFPKAVRGFALGLAN